jgi:hypothetical protein
MKLDRLVVERLFGDGAWLAGSESAVALNRILDELGLQEQVPGTVNTSRWTDLGARFNMGLLIVFLGLHWEWEVPDILEQNHLLDKEESRPFSRFHWKREVRLREQLVETAANLSSEWA